MEDEDKSVDELVKKHIEINKKIARDPNQDWKERMLAESKLKKYFAALQLLYG